VEDLCERGDVPSPLQVRGISRALHEKERRTFLMSAMRSVGSN
jgi:hypothetical protein